MLVLSTSQQLSHVLIVMVVVVVVVAVNSSHRAYSRWTFGRTQSVDDPGGRTVRVRVARKPQQQQ